MRLLLLLCTLLTLPAFATPGLPVPDHAVPCAAGVAEGFPCSNVDLASHVTNAQLGGGNGNDIWGWTDPDTQKEYALMGLTNGTAFVDVSDPEFPVRLGRLPTHNVNSTWRDIKTRGYYAFIVSEAVDHGMQVFDLRRLRGAVSSTTIYTEDAYYNQFGRAHNIVIDTDSGYAFAVGSRQGTQTCNGGLHIININNPLVPTFAGCFSADGYTHDAQCLTYSGPDTDYSGHRICLASNEDTVTIVDVSNPAAPVQISRTGYAGSAYTHQGWLTQDRHYFLVDDEVDEINNGHNTHTYVFDVSDLDAPVLHTTYTAGVAASDHNLYIVGRYAYESNYLSGLRILDLVNIDSGVLSEVGYFDTHPESNAAGTSGAWSVYPFFASGTVILSDISAGLFVLEPKLCAGPSPPTGLSAAAAGDQQIALSWDAGASGTSYEVHRAIGGCGSSETQIANALATPNLLDAPVSGGISYGYRVRQRSADGLCLSDFSTCQATQTTGLCTAAPAFAGIASATTPGATQCSVDLGWVSATPRCAGPLSYTVERSPGASFDPQQSTVLASGLTGNAYSDTSASYNSSYSYRVHAVDVGNGSADANTISLSATPQGPSSDGSFASGAEIGEPALGASGPSRHVGWEVVNDLAHSGQRSYFSTYSNSNCLALYSPPLTLSAGQSSVLNFYTRYGIEAGWDAGLVQITTNSGATWQTITPNGGYPSVMNNQNSTDACGFANGQPAFTGTNLNWQPVSFNLSAYSGEISVRWLFSTDGGATAEGWWIDDVNISHVQVPGMCTTLSPDRIFVNGFEGQ